MTGHNIQMLTGFRWLDALIGVGVFVFAACAQMMQPAFAARATNAYVGNFKDNTVSVIDTAAGMVVATV